MWQNTIFGIPKEIQILHNTGVFGYDPMALLMFLADVAAGLLALILLTVFLCRMRSRRIALRGRVLAAALAVSLGVYLAVAWRPVAAKVSFARGYDHAQWGRDVAAGEWYLRALRWDPTFRQPMAELMAWYRDSGRPAALLAKIRDRVERAGVPAFYFDLARIEEENGHVTGALRAYRMAGGTREAILGEARSLLAMNDLDAAERVLRSAGWGGRNPEPDEVTLLRAAIAFRRGRFDEADALTDAVISSETVRRDDDLLKGRIRAALGDPDGALNRFAAATALSPSFADAYFEAAKIHYARRDVAQARMALEKTLYYDNTQAPAFVMLALVNDDRRLPLEAIRSRNADGEAGVDDAPPISLVKGETRVVDVTLTGLPHPSRCRIGLLEPYGFGIRSTLVRSEMIGSPDGQTTISLAIRLTGVRDDSVNLGRPWPLTIVAADLDSGAYVTARRFVSVENRPGEEGRILFVMTEDLEQTGDFPHVDDTPEVMDNDADEIRIDFIDKPAFADALANEFGVKWSHMVDVGSAMLRLQWLRDGAHGGAWNDLWDRMAAYLERTVSAGHDVQLHIHGYNIPGNRLFRQFFDTERDRVMFTGNQSRVANADGHHGAWAANYERLGDRDDVESRWGSIFRGVRELEGLLHESHPAYATTFFRAGEYEFGQSGTDTTRSIVALRASGILADSSAVSGSPFRRDFKFFRRAGRNVYFSRPDRIQERALSLQDIGILELLPVPRLHGHDYLGPTDEFRHVQYNYDLCMEDGRVRNDIFVLMEMYHLGNANHAHQWNRLDADYQDWKRMRDQWRRLRRECPRIEPVTATEAIRIWLDRYAPDVIARRGAERKLSDSVYQYEVELLGADIEVSDQRPHFVALQPPSYWMNRIDKIELLQYGSVVATWTGVTGCGHLEFRVTTPRGYSLKVYVKPDRTPGAGGEAASRL